MTLRTIVTDVISNQPGYQSVRELIGLFHRLATSYLKKKAASGTFNTNLFGIPLEDVAFDCVADLFNRNQDGVFEELKKYYTGLNLPDIDDELLMGMTRRLVFSKVVLDLHRQYRDIDPSLHKLMRNVKEAVASMDLVTIDCCNDRAWILFEKEAVGESSQPVMASELLEAHISAAIAGSGVTKDVLLALQRMFVDQSIYRRAYPLLPFALAFRSAFARLGEIPDFTEEHGSAVSMGEINSHISNSNNQIRAAMWQTYVGKKKVDERTFSLYLLAVEDILRDEFASDDHVDGGYYEHLRAHWTDLARPEYRDNHRAYLEYLVRLTREQFLKDMKRELGFFPQGDARVRNTVRKNGTH